MTDPGYRSESRTFRASPASGKGSARRASSISRRASAALPCFAYTRPRWWLIGLERDLAEPDHGGNPGGLEPDGLPERLLGVRVAAKRQRGGAEHLVAHGGARVGPDEVLRHLERGLGVALLQGLDGGGELARDALRQPLGRRLAPQRRDQGCPRRGGSGQRERQGGEGDPESHGLAGELRRGPSNRVYHPGRMAATGGLGARRRVPLRARLVAAVSGGRFRRGAEPGAAPPLRVRRCCAPGSRAGRASSPSTRRRRAHTRGRRPGRRRAGRRARRRRSRRPSGRRAPRRPAPA